MNSVSTSAKEAAKITGLSTATLRYYEKENLLPPIKRNEQGYRDYSDADIEWINMIQCLRSANVPIQSIKKYIALLLQGSETLVERLSVVKEYRESLINELECIRVALKLANSKIGFYEELLQNHSSCNFSYLEEWELFQKRGNK